MPESVSLVDAERHSRGVPDSTPILVLKRSRVGALPMCAQVYGVVPPRATRVTLYACPLVPCGSDEVTIVGGPLTFDALVAEVSELAAVVGVAGVGRSEAPVPDRRGLEGRRRGRGLVIRSRGENDRRYPPWCRSRCTGRAPTAAHTGRRSPSRWGCRPRSCRSRGRVAVGLPDGDGRVGRGRGGGRPGRRHVEALIGGGVGAGLCSWCRPSRRRRSTRSPSRWA